MEVILKPLMAFPKQKELTTSIYKFSCYIYATMRWPGHAQLTASAWETSLVIAENTQAGLNSRYVIGRWV